MDMTTKSIADIQIAGVLANKGTTEILAEVLAAHPGAGTSKACVAWYRNHVKTDPKPKFAAARAGHTFVPGPDGRTGAWTKDAPAAPDGSAPTEEGAAPAPGAARGEAPEALRKGKRDEARA